MEVANTHEWSDVRKLDGDHDELFMTREDLCKYAMTVHTEVSVRTTPMEIVSDALARVSAIPVV